MNEILCSAKMQMESDVVTKKTRYFFLSSWIHPLHHQTVCIFCLRYNLCITSFWYLYTPDTAQTTNSSNTTTQKTGLVGRDHSLPSPPSLTLIIIAINVHIPINPWLCGLLSAWWLMNLIMCLTHSSCFITPLVLQPANLDKCDPDTETLHGSLCGLSTDQCCCCCCYCCCCCR